MWDPASMQEGPAEGETVLRLLAEAEAGGRPQTNSVSRGSLGGATELSAKTRDVLSLLHALEVGIGLLSRHVTTLDGFVQLPPGVPGTDANGHLVEFALPRCRSQTISL